MEIFRFGDKFKFGREFNQYVRPSQRPLLSNYIKNLTGVTQEVIDTQGINLQDAIGLFRAFVPKHSLLCSNGDDWSILALNCRLSSMKNPFDKASYINVRPFLAKRLQLERHSDQLHSHRLGMAESSFNNNPHDALSDARSVAETLMLMNWDFKS